MYNAQLNINRIKRESALNDSKIFILKDKWKNIFLFFLQ